MHCLIIAYDSACLWQPVGVNAQTGLPCKTSHSFRRRTQIRPRACNRSLDRTHAYAFRNYVKFLCDRTGRPIKRYGPAFDPLDFEGDVRLALAGRDPTPEECVLHPGRKVCNVDRILASSA